MDDDTIVSGRSTPLSGRSTSSTKQKGAASTATTTQLRSETVLKEALNALEKNQDDAQIFGDFIASSIRELDTVEKQQALKRTLNRALLDFQDAQNRPSYQQHYQPPYQASSYSLTSASTLNPSNPLLPPFGTINSPLDPQDAFGAQYQNL